MQALTWLFLVGLFSYLYPLHTAWMPQCNSFILLVRNKLLDYPQTIMFVKTKGPLLSHSWNLIVMLDPTTSIKHRTAVNCRGHPFELLVRESEDAAAPSVGSNISRLVLPWQEPKVLLPFFGVLQEVRINDFPEASLLASEQFSDTCIYTQITFHDVTDSTLHVQATTGNPSMHLLTLFLLSSVINNKSTSVQVQ